MLLIDRGVRLKGDPEGRFLFVCTQYLHCGRVVRDGPNVHSQLFGVGQLIGGYHLFAFDETSHPIFVRTYPT